MVTTYYGYNTEFGYIKDRALVFALKQDIVLRL